MAAPRKYGTLFIDVKGIRIYIEVKVTSERNHLKYRLNLSELRKTLKFSNADYADFVSLLRISANNNYNLDFILNVEFSGDELLVIFKQGVKLSDGDNQRILMQKIEDITVAIDDEKNTKPNTPSTSATTPANTSNPKYKVGDYILYEVGGVRYVYKVQSISNNVQKTYVISYKDYKKNIEEATSIDWNNLEGRSELLQIKDGDRFIVNTQKFPSLEVIVKSPNYLNKTNYQFVLTDAKNGAAFTNVKTAEEIKDLLYQWLASEVKNTPSAVSSNNEPHNFIFANKTGNIYSIVVDKVQQNYVDLIYYDEGVQETSVNVPIQTIAQNYSAINVDKHKEFLLPAKGLPPIKVYYTSESTNYGIRHILLGDDGKKYGIYSSVNDMLKDLLQLEAKVVLQEKILEQTEDISDKKTESYFDQEIEQLNKDIAQLMFFKSLLSPIDFEKKIEISQEISKKQQEVDKLNFYLLEKRLQSDNIFDELFEQSFTPIKNAYSGVYTKGSDETDFFTPNGQKSKLSDALNLMIRTPQFKAWFGDWELAYLYKDTDAVEIDCSKVLTEDFEPMLVWHGTGQEFSYFKFDTFPAAYFAVNSQYSQFFADLHGGDDGFVIPFFLNIRNPLDLTHFKTNDVSVKDFFDYIFLQTGMDMDDLEVNPIFMDSTLKPMQTWIYIRNNPNMLKKIAALNVFDGIRFYETNPNIKDKSSLAYQTEAFVTFNANQSKIADPDRGTILLASMKSFILEKGGAI